MRRAELWKCGARKVAFSEFRAADLNFFFADFFSIVRLRKGGTARLNIA